MTRAIRLFVALARWCAPFAPVPLAFALLGCGHKIGDSCTQSTDCSATGTLVCDTSQPDGYCTQLNCTENSCMNDGVCTLFQATVPGCGYNDYHSPSRTGRSFCLAYCTQDSDCRQSEGYVCRDPTKGPWYAQVLDDLQGRLVCIDGQGLLASTVPDVDAAVCSYLPADAAPLEETEAGADAALDGAADAGASTGPDGGMDAGAASAADGGDAGGIAGPDGEVEAGVDATIDGSNDASVDAGSADAPGGG
jgi:hypothetical protein